MQQAIDDVESAWEKEITDRVLAVEEGTAIGIDYDEAMRMLSAEKEHRDKLT